MRSARRLPIQLQVRYLRLPARRRPVPFEGEAFAVGLGQAGVATTATRYPGMCHEFFGMATVVDGAAQAQQEAGNALRTVSANAAAHAPMGAAPGRTVVS